MKVCCKTNFKYSTASLARLPALATPLYISIELRTTSIRRQFEIMRRERQIFLNSQSLFEHNAGIELRPIVAPMR
jgi:hypothetical protein